MGPTTVTSHRTAAGTEKMTCDGNKASEKKQNASRTRGSQTTPRVCLVTLTPSRTDAPGVRVALSLPTLTSPSSLSPQTLSLTPTNHRAGGTRCLERGPEALSEGWVPQCLSRPEGSGRRVESQSQSPPPTPDRRSRGQSQQAPQGTRRGHPAVAYGSPDGWLHPVPLPGGLATAKAIRE